MFLPDRPVHKEQFSLEPNQRRVLIPICQQTGGTRSFQDCRLQEVESTYKIKTFVFLMKFSHLKQVLPIK